MKRLLALFGQLICKSEQTSPVVVINRDYEWRDHASCSGCRRTTRHTYIEWIEPGHQRVTTKECQWCGLETEVAREEAAT